MCAMSTYGRKSLDLVSCFISRETRKKMSGGGKYYKEYGMSLQSLTKGKSFCFQQMLIFLFPAPWEGYKDV
uniref:Putative ovule protein n=1 Tax=Solanum chacoense TaxID=4108 RepID=A0A0V0GLA4_SOLCH